MSKYATSICASQFAFTAIIKKTKASPRIRLLNYLLYIKCNIYHNKKKILY